MQTGTVTLASSDDNGNQLAGFSFYPDISADGHSVAFVQFTSNDTGLTSDVYVKNLDTGALTLASSSSDGTQGDGPSTHPAISADGHFVAFSSTANNLVSANVTGDSDVFVKDLQTGATTLVSANATGNGGDGLSDSPTISDDGSKIAFESTSDDLVTGDANQGPRRLRRRSLDRDACPHAGQHRDSNGGEANDVSYDARITPDGTQVLFTSNASNLVADDTNGQADVFVKNLATGSLSRVDTAQAGTEADQGATAGVLDPAGDKVAGSPAPSDNLVPGDDNAQADVFVKTLDSGAVQLVTAGASVNIGANSDSTLSARHTQVSDDGRYLVYTSSASNLVPGADTNGSATDVYWYDRVTGQTVRVSQADDGTQGDKASSAPSISGDGTIVAFQSDADNLVPGDTNGKTDVFIASPISNQVALLSQTIDGVEGNGNSYDIVVSRDFQWAVFVTDATNLFNDQQPNFSDVVLEDLLTGAFTVVSADATGHQGAGNATAQSISDDGRYVTFLSDAPDLLPGGVAGQTDVYVKDMVTGDLTRVSSGVGGATADGPSSDPSISGDGSKIVFASEADNLIDGDTNGVSDVFVADRASGVIRRVSQTPAGDGGNSVSETPSISQDGRYVAFASFSSNLVDNDTNQHEDVFLADLQAGTITLISAAPDDTGADGASTFATISGSGRVVAFTSQASNLSADDVNQFGDVFVSVLNAPPDIVLNVPDSIAEGDSLTLDASGTTDPEGDPLTFSWDLNGDGVYGDATGPVVNLSWADLQANGFDDGPTFRNINLQVTDSFGTTVRSIQMPLVNTAPTGTIVPGDVGTVEGQTADFTATATDPSDADTAAGFTYSWAATVNGNPLTTGTGTSFSFTLSDNGGYVVTLTVTDKDGGASTSVYTFNADNAPPAIDLSAAPTTGAAGTPIAFDAAATDPGSADVAAGLDVVWTVTKDGQPFATGTGTHVAFTPDAAASYEVDMTVTDKDGDSSSGSATIDIAAATGSLPVVDTSAAPDTGIPNQEIDFSVVATHTGPVTFTWNVMKDGSLIAAGNSDEIDFTPPANGSYVVTVNATDTVGTGTGTVTITVTDVSSPPIVDLSAAPVTGTSGTEIDFTATAQSLSTSGVPPTFAWTVTKDGQPFAAGDGPDVGFTPDADASYDVTVTATDDTGTGSTTVTIVVGNSNVVINPSLSVTGPSTFAPGVAYTLGFANVDAGTNPITGYTIDWGDGLVSSFNGSPAAKTHTYDSSTNSRSITVTVTTAAGNFQVGQKSLLLVDSAPTTSITGPATVSVNVLYTLQVAAIQDIEGVTVSAYVIHWGDGSTDNGTGLPPSTLSHTYTVAGDYAVTLDLVDASGPEPDNASTGVTVTATTNPGGPSFLSGNTINLAGTGSFSQTVSFADPSGGPWTGTVDYGDGTGSQSLSIDPAAAMTFALGHVFSANGTYTVQVSLSDAGSSATGTFTVIVAGLGGPAFQSGDVTNLAGTGSFSKTVPFTDPAGGPWTGSVDFGDGTGSQPLSVDPNAMTFALGHLYSANGTYTVNVSLADSNQSATGSFTVVVTGLGVIIGPSGADREPGRQRHGDDRHPVPRADRLDHRHRPRPADRERRLRRRHRPAVASPSPAVPSR